MSRLKSDLVVFGLLGLATFASLFWVQVHWLEIAARLMGRDRIIFDEQPAWVRDLGGALSVLPWAVCLGLLGLALLQRRSIPLLAFAGAQAVGWGAVLAVVLGGPVVRDYASRLPFDSAAWKAENRPGAEGVRVRMVDDLLRKHALVGMSRARVEGLLGVPPDSPFFRSYDYVYWLGLERGAFGIDSEWLVLDLEGDVVVKAEVVTD